VPNARVRANVTSWDILAFVGTMHYRLRAVIRALDRAPWPWEEEVHSALISAMLLLPAQVQDALVCLGEIEPKIAAQVAVNKRAVALWRHFRHDAAHLADRTFRNNPKYNVAAFTDEKGEPGFDVGHYDPRTGEVWTGARPEPGKAAKIEDAVALIGAVFAALDSAITKGPVQRQPPNLAEAEDLRARMRDVVRLETEPRPIT
jgi:hypothetical protein